MPRVKIADYGAIRNARPLRANASSVKHPATALAEYAAALSDPFNGRHIKVPFNPPPSGTSPVTCYARGTFQTNTAGFGFLTFAPSYANDDSCITYSLATGTTTTVNPNPVALETAQQVFVGSPYPISNFLTPENDGGNGTQKILARWGRCAFRIQNVTDAQSRGGTAFMGQINGGMASSRFVDNSTYPLLKQQMACLDVDVNGKWNTWNVLPVGTQDFGFDYYSTYRPMFSMATTFPGTGNPFQFLNVSPCFAFVTAPNAATVQTYQWEIMFDFDYLQPACQTPAGLPQTNSTSLPTPCPPHHVGVSSIGHCLATIRASQTSAAETEPKKESTAAKLGHFLRSMGHDIDDPKAILQGGLSALGFQGASAFVDSLGTVASVMGAGFM